MRSRELKGKHILAIPDNYVMIDIETTGLSYEYDSIIEIGAIRVVNNEVVEEFSELIWNPCIGDFISRLTGIKQEELDAARKSKEVLKDFYDFIKPDDIILGYNVHFDINFLYDEIEQYLHEKLSNDFVDIMRYSSKFLLKKLGKIKLGILAEYFGIDYNKRHRSLVDCYTTKAVYENLRELLIQEIGDISNYNKNKQNVSNLEYHIDVESPFYDKTLIFTGKLELFTRQEATKKVLEVGGKVSTSVNKNVDYLVVGSFDYCNAIKGNLSSKHKKALELKENGEYIEVIDEKTFLNMIQ